MDDGEYFHTLFYQARKVEERSITCFRYLHSKNAVLLTLDVNGYVRGFEFAKNTDHYSGIALPLIVFQNNTFYSVEEALALSLVEQSDVARFADDATVYEYWGLQNYYHAPSLAE